MPRPVLAYHVILCNYGFWLPNDPRGSWSTFVRAPNIRRHGPATFVGTRTSVASRPHDSERRQRAKRDLVRPAVELTGRQALSVAHGFADRIRGCGYTVYACAILPDHSHLVIARHRYCIEQVVRVLRQQATMQLLADGLHPFANERLASGRLPSVWCQDFWKVFLYDSNDIDRSVKYVEQNPERAGLKAQRWSFVTQHAGPADDASAMRR